MSWSHDGAEIARLNQQLVRVSKERDDLATAAKGASVKDRTDSCRFGGLHGPDLLPCTEECEEKS